MAKHQKVPTIYPRKGLAGLGNGRESFPWLVLFFLIRRREDGLASEPREMQDKADKTPQLVDRFGVWKAWCKI